jgi:hypothetical protein
MSAALRLAAFAAVIIAVLTFLKMFGSMSAHSDEVSRFNGVLTIVTLGCVVLQLFFAFEQVEIAKRQTAILDRQNELTFGTVDLSVSSVGPVDFDRLAETVELGLMLRNRGTRIARNVYLRLKLPSAYTLTSESWKELTAQRDTTHRLWERSTSIPELAPHAVVPKISVPLKRTVFYEGDHRVYWSAAYEGGIAPPLGGMAVLTP